MPARASWRGRSRRCLFTSPRLRGEAGLRSTPGEGVQVSLQSHARRQPLTPTLSPQERGEGARRDPALLIRPELELAVAFQIRAAAHVELAVVADEEQRALWHLLGALQKFAGIAGAHLVGEGLAVLVIGVAGVGLELPRCCSGLRQCGCSERAEHGRHQKYPCRKCHHPILPIEAPGLNKSRTALPGQFAKAPQRITSCRAVCDFPFVPARLCSAFRLERNSTKTLGRG